MGFVIWHYLCRVVALPLFVFVATSSFAPTDSLWEQAGRFATYLLIAMGLNGATLAILLLFTPFRFRCPRCRKRLTEFGGSKRDGMWLACDSCQTITAESGFLKLRLQTEPIETGEEEE